MDKFELIAEMLRKFPGWKAAGADDLRALLAGELGGLCVFDEGIRLGNCRRVALRPRSALLVCAGTLPESSWQALARLALVETQRLFVKLPDAPCADVVADAARWMLARGLFSEVEVSRSLPRNGLDGFEVIVVFGTGESVSFFRGLASWHKKFLAYGNKFSLTVVNGRDVHLETARDVVKDVLSHSQQGCLAPHVCYVCDGDAGMLGAFCSRAFREALAAGAKIPKWDVVAAARIFTARRAEVALGSEVFAPEDGSLAWTVVVSTSEEFEISPCHLFLCVKKCDSLERLSQLLAPWRDSVSTIALSQNQRPPCGTGASRFCAVGRMQQPSLFWTQDGFLALAEMVSWVSYEEG